MFAVTVKGRLRSFLCASLSVWCVLCCTCCPDEKIYETLAEKFGAVVVLLFGATNCNSVNWVVITSSANRIIRGWYCCRYVQGVLCSKCADDPGVDDAARWMDMTIRACDADVVEDWEVDELLSWSTGLDFDDYWKHWHSIATSDLSEAAVCTLF